jgi:hypothetical protein
MSEDPLEFAAGDANIRRYVGTQLFSTRPESAQAVTYEVQPAESDDGCIGAAAVTGCGLVGG